MSGAVRLISILLLRRLGCFVTCYIIEALLFWATEWRWTLSETSVKFEPTTSVYAGGVGETGCRRLTAQIVSWRNWSLFNQSNSPCRHCDGNRWRRIDARSDRIGSGGLPLPVLTLSLYSWSTSRPLRLKNNHVVLKKYYSHDVIAQFLRHPQSE